MLSGYGGILDNSSSLPRSKVFMKSRYPVLTSGFDFTNALEGIKYCTLEKTKALYLDTSIFLIKEYWTALFAPCVNVLQSITHSGFICFLPNCFCTSAISAGCTLDTMVMTFLYPYDKRRGHVIA